MDLRDSEKLILAMLCELSEKLVTEPEIDPKFVMKAIGSGNTWGLAWKYYGLFGDSNSKTPEIVIEVGNILDMWSCLEDSFSALSGTDKKTLAEKADPFGKEVRFRGFDGNNEGEQMSIADFLIADLDRFSEFKGRDLNSHCPSIDCYRRMLAVYEPIQKKTQPRHLNVDDLAAILNAMRYPG